MNTPTRAPPQTPIQAVPHPDPYPYYRDLVLRRPLYYDETLRLWVAASADRVMAVLTNGLCHVRPSTEPVPKVLGGSAAGIFFGHLIRMNDGPRHDPLKHVVSATLGAIELNYVEESCDHWAKTLFTALDPTDYAFQVPAYVLADLLGFPGSQLAQVAVWIRDFVCSLSPLINPEPIERGKDAAAHLLNHTQSLLASQKTGPTGGLLSQLHAESVPIDQISTDAVIANGIG